MTYELFKQKKAPNSRQAVVLVSSVVSIRNRKLFMVLGFYFGLVFLF